MPETPHVLLGVCGGIAAYKSAELVRDLQRAGIEVRVIMTRSAQEFIQPLTFASLTGHRVFTDLWAATPDSAEGASAIEHIAQAQWADALLIAPATAHTLAKLAHGLANDFLSATYLAATAPVILAPAMNANMLHHAATTANLETLRSRGHRIVEPDSGYLACGMIGDGRLAENGTLVRAVLDTLKDKLRPLYDLAGETVLITAGGTREPIDPVRFLGNHSSGKMGYALAAEAQQRGARVILISAAVAIAPPPLCEIVSIQTADEMHAAVLDHLPRATIVLKAAAVADFRPRERSLTKLHRAGPLTLQFEPTEDIVRSAVEHRRAETLVIAFAAEMGLDLERARRKLYAKGVDAIVLNDISRPGIGFGSDRNAAVFVTADDAIDIAEAPKTEVANRILDGVVALRASGLRREAAASDDPLTQPASH